MNRCCDSLVKQRFAKEDQMVRRFEHFTNVSEVLECLEKKADLLSLEQVKQSKVSHCELD